MSSQKFYIWLWWLWPILPLSLAPFPHIDRRALALWCLGGIALLFFLAPFWKHNNPRISQEATSSPQHQRGWWLWGIYISGVCLATALSYDPTHSILGGEAQRLGFLTLVAAPVAGLYLQRHRRIILPGLFVQSVVLALVALWWHRADLAAGIRLKAPFFQANALATWFTCGAVAGWFWWPTFLANTRSQLRWPRGCIWLFWSSQLLLVTCIILTHSRGGLLLLCCAGFYWLVQQRKKNQPLQAQTKTEAAANAPLGRSAKEKMVFGSLLPVQGIQRRAWLVAGTFVFVLGLGFLWSSQLQARFLSTEALARAIAYRGALLEHGLKLLGETPPWGWGPDMLFEVFGALHPLPTVLQSTFGSGILIDSTHNVYLDRWLELGWAGGSAYLVIAVGGLLRGRAFQSQQNQDAAAAQGLWLMAVILMVRQLWSVTTLELEVCSWLVLACLWFPPEDLATAASRSAAQSTLAAEPTIPTETPGS